MHFADERHIRGDSSEEIGQSAPIAKTLFQYGLVGIPLVILLPYGVKSVNVCDYYIHLASVWLDKDNVPLMNCQIYRSLLRTAPFVPIQTQIWLYRKISIAIVKLQYHYSEIRISL